MIVDVDEGDHQKSGNETIIDYPLGAHAEAQNHTHSHKTAQNFHHDIPECNGGMAVTALAPQDEITQHWYVVIKSDCGIAFGAG